MRRTILLPVLLALLLTGCGQRTELQRTSPVTPRPKATTQFTIQDLDVLGGEGRMLVPRRPNGKLVLYVHGGGGNGTTVVDDRLLLPLWNTLLKRGFTIVGGNGGGDAWGSGYSVRSYAALVVAAREVVPGTELYLLGQSLGGLTSLRLINLLPGVRAWAGIYPVCNLNAVFDRFRAQFDNALGAELTAARKSFSPLVPRLRPGFPMLMWASDGDTVVPKATNAALCLPLFRAAGAKAGLIPTVGNHGDPSNFQPTRLTAFFEAAG